MTARRRYLSGKDKLLVRQRQDNLCACGCKEPLAMGGTQYDHALPLSLGGSNDLENFRALNPRHHMKKTIRELKARAKIARIQTQDGLRIKKKSRADKAMEKFLGAKT